MRTPAMTPVGAVVRGLASAAVGTLAMDLLLFARYKRGDGKSGFREWELSEGDRRAGTRRRHRRRSASGWSRACSSATFRTGSPHWSTTSRTGATGSSAARRTGSSSAPSRRPRVWFGAAVRRRGVGVGLRRPARGGAVPADLGVRPPHARERPQRPPRLRPHHGCGVPGAVPATRTVDMPSDPAALEALAHYTGPLSGTPHPTIADVVVATLKASGVRRIYGLPGRLAERPDGRAPPRRRDHVAARPARGGGGLRGGR